MKLLLYTISLFFIVSCGLQTKYFNVRFDKGNTILFVYFKSEIEKRDSLPVEYYGGQTEVTNYQYWNFLEYLRENDSDGYQLHKPKSKNWLAYASNFYFADSLSVYYDSLEYFGDYPVVNVTFDDALAYVNWLNSFEPDSLVYYRLFTENEFEDFFNEVDSGENSFSWGGTYWLNDENERLGNFAEFNQNHVRTYPNIKNIYFKEQDSVGFQFYVDGPKKAYSYSPNCWGGYNLSGNVSELVLESSIEVDEKRYNKTIGGSWASPIYYLRKASREYHSLPSPYVGFRVLKTKRILSKS